MTAWPQNIGEWLGQPIRTEFEWAQAIRRRLPTEIITAFLTRGLTKDEFHEIVIPARTFKHRRTRVEALSVDESDKALRAARVLARAEAVFANRGKALSWMRKPKTRHRAYSHRYISYVLL